MCYHALQGDVVERVLSTIGPEQRLTRFMYRCTWRWCCSAFPRKGNGRCVRGDTLFVLTPPLFCFFILSLSSFSFTLLAFWSMLLGRIIRHAYMETWLTIDRSIVPWLPWMDSMSSQIAGHSMTISSHFSNTLSNPSSNTPPTFVNVRTCSATWSSPPRKATNISELKPTRSTSRPYPTSPRC